MHTRRHSGFTIVEMMLVVAIAALMVALAVPSWQRVNDNIRMRAAARAALDTFRYARMQAVRTGRRHMVLSQTGLGLDACGAAIPSPLMVLDDANQNCCVDAGEPTWVPEELGDPMVQAVAFWGTTNATLRVPEDGGAGAMTTGSTFTRVGGGAANGVVFRGDGIPVSVTAACGLGSVGTGSGGFYFTNGRPGLDAAQRRDLAVVLTSVGTAKSFSWDASTARWTQ